MPPNHFEVEEVSRIRRDEAMQQAMHGRLGRIQTQQDSNRLLKVERSTNTFGWLRQRLAFFFKRDACTSTRSVTDYP